MAKQKQEVASANYTVYQHICPNGKSYFGITRIKPEKRWSNGHGYRFNSYFQNAIKKYGWDNIVHTIIETSLTKEQAMQMERDLIAKYKTNRREYGYNITSGGECIGKHAEESKEKMRRSHTGLRYNIGVPFTEERKRHLSEHHADVRGEKNPMYGKKKPAEEIARRLAHRVYKSGGESPSARKIVQLKDGEIIKIWGSISEASKQYCRTSIKDCLRGKYKQHRGYQWKYLEGEQYVGD